jgi:hypothetical protein
MAWFGPYALSAFLAARIRSFTVCSYSASLNAKSNAAVKTLWVILGPIPVIEVSAAGVVS